MSAQGELSNTSTNWYGHRAIEYGTRPTRDPVHDLVSKVQSGTLQLTAEGPSGFLRSVLRALDVPVESQLAVFAKDSLQAALINRDNPRTIFFNDSVAVSWVRGGFIELASQDPEQGVRFYTLTTTSEGSPSFSHTDECLLCHYSNTAAGVPGMLVRSSGHMMVDHRLPFEERWGGWYVTGQHGSLRHKGNVETRSAASQSSDGLNWTSLEGKFDTTGYLTPYSDIAALMVFEHQMPLLNLLTRIDWEARVAAYQKGQPKLSGAIAPTREADRVIPLDQGAREIVDYLLLIDEAPLADAIHGSTEFSTKFSAVGPRDRKGRSLRDLDLNRRLLRYPCSYLIYSRQFDALPSDARNAIYERMWRILSGEERDGRYNRLSRTDREAVIEILIDTKPGLPRYFRPLSP
jgi:hypothetical protein